jgi:16S rRNA (guanine527-N7)-methyltransferase
VAAGNRGSLESMLAGSLAAMGISAELPWERLEWLGQQWLRFGRVINLTGARDVAALAEQVLESIQVVELARRIGCAAGQRWVDVGSGAGFPGLVVAACLPVEVVLVEPREKRAAFLELMLAQMGRAGSVRRGRVDGQGAQEAFDWASARAVFAPPRWLEVARGLVRPGGVVVVHLHQGDAEMVGGRTVGRVEGGKWSVRGVECFT